MEPNDPKRFKHEVGERIKTVRTASGHRTRADLSRYFPDWSEGRLANYENGTSLPAPADILRIAEQTGTNPCWILFGRGAMYSREPDIHQIRRQNLARICAGLDPSARRNLMRDLKIKSREFNALFESTTARIAKSLCRKVEKCLELEQGSMDRPPAGQYPAQTGLSPGQAELLALFDGLDPRAQAALINLARDLRYL